MTDQSLRAALEQKLAATTGWAVSNEFLLGLLAAHPAEPAPVVTDEAVEVVAAEFMARYKGTRNADVFALTGARVALEAAAPLLSPRPQVGVVHVQHADAEEYARIFNLGFAEAVEQYKGSPLLDREAVRRIFVDAINAYVLGGVPTYYAHVDAVMELARPMPTREALGILLHSFDGFAIETGEQWSECNEDRQGAFLYQAATVLALLNGAGA
jgi:hypothetical protein